MEASLRLKEEHDDASERVDQFIREGDAVLNFAAGIMDDGDHSSGVRSGSSSSSSGDTKGNTCDGGGSGSGGSGRRRKKQPGYVQEDDSDSDDGEHQARIMRSRGPVTLVEAFAVPLLRSCVAAAASSQEGAANAGGSGTTEARDTATSRRARGWKGKGKQPASRRSCKSDHEDEEEEEEGGAEGGVSDEQLLEVFRYWSKKREGYGGPMLRCFHPFMMRLWRRMEDPVREVTSFFFIWFSTPCTFFAIFFILIASLHTSVLVGRTCRGHTWRLGQHRSFFSPPCLCLSLRHLS